MFAGEPCPRLPVRSVQTVETVQAPVGCLHPGSTIKGGVTARVPAGAVSAKMRGRAAPAAACSDSQPQGRDMYGRDVFMESLLAHGVQHLFGNPGTTESPLIDSLARYQGIDYVLALHEGVAIGAASYYAQACGRAGVVNLHVAPGLGNAIGMIFGALRTNSPMVVTAGQQDTRLRLRDPILGHDLVAMAAPVVKWSVQAESADEIAPVMRRAFKIAHDAPSGPVFVALPINVMEQQTEVAARAAGPLYRAPPPDAEGRRRRRPAPAGRQRACNHDRRRCRACRRGRGPGRAGGGRGRRHLDRADPPTPAGAQHAPQLPGPHPHRPRHHRQGLRRGGRGADGGRSHSSRRSGTRREGPFPPGAAVLQVEESTERLARNHGLDAGLIAGPRGPRWRRSARWCRSERQSDAYYGRRRPRSATGVFAALREDERADRRARLDAIRGRPAHAGADHAGSAWRRRCRRMW